MEFICFLVADPAPICLASSAVHVIASVIFLSPSSAHRAILYSNTSSRPETELCIICLRTWSTIVARKETLSAYVFRTFITFKMTFFVFLAEFFLALRSLTICVGAVEKIFISGNFQRQQESLHSDILILGQDLLQFVIFKARLTFIIQAF